MKAMASTTRPQFYEPRPSTIGWLLLAGCMGMAVSGCGVFYQVRSTPVRGAVSEDRYQPPPPKDVLFVAFKQATIPPKTRDGRNWDSVGGAAPDTYGILFIDDEEVLRTVVVPNSLHPVWSNPPAVNLKIPDSAKVRVELWDDNAMVSHPICIQGIRDIQDAASVGQIEIDCDSGASVVLAVQLPRARLGIGLFYDVRGKTAFVSRVVGASAAGRAGLTAGDQILSAEGRPVAQMADGELEGMFGANSSHGITLEVVGSGGGTRKITLRDEPMYPIKGEGIEILVGKNVETGAD
jgi:hypothetical protein